MPNSTAMKMIGNPGYCPCTTRKDVGFGWSWSGGGDKEEEERDVEIHGGVDGWRYHK